MGGFWREVGKEALRPVAMGIDGLISVLTWREVRACLVGNKDWPHVKEKSCLRLSFSEMQVPRKMRIR